MLYLLHTHWLWFFGAGALGIIVGWLTYLREAPRWTDRPVHIAVGLVVLGAIVAIAKLVPGRYGYWLELGVIFAIVYAIGCFVGWALRDLADYMPATAEAGAAATTSYLFRDAHAGTGTGSPYMRTSAADAAPRERLSLGAGALTQAPAPGGYTFPATQPFADATARQPAEPAPGVRRHWSWSRPAHSAEVAAAPAFTGSKGGYIFPATATDAAPAAAPGAGTTRAGLYRHWSWRGRAAAPVATTPVAPAVASGVRDVAPAVAAVSGEAPAPGGYVFPAAAPATAPVAASRGGTTRGGHFRHWSWRGAAGADAPAPSIGGASPVAPSASDLAVGMPSAMPSVSPAAPAAAVTPPGSAASPSNPSKALSPPGAASGASAAIASTGSSAGGPAGAPLASRAAGGGTPASSPGPASLSPAATSGAAPSPVSIADAPASPPGTPTSVPATPPSTAAGEKPLASPPAAASASPSSATSAPAPAGGPLGGSAAASGSPQGAAGGSPTAAPASIPAPTPAPSSPSAAGDGASQGSLGGDLASTAAPPAPPAEPLPPAAVDPVAAGLPAAPPAAPGEPAVIAAVPGEEKHAGERPVGLMNARDNRADDLKRIRGIGPQNEGRLHGLGIWHFDQIAAWTPDNVRWVGSYLAFPGRIDREKWVEQAAALAAGGETEFSRRARAGKVATSRDDGSEGQANVDAGVASRPRPPRR